jgi:CRP/FNR family transcriptional regulator
MENGGSMQDLDEELSKFCPVAEYREGELIYGPCQQETKAYIIRRGQVKLYHLDESGKRLTLAILGEGNLFGEMALVGEEHRESSAEALEDCSCWVIEREELLARARTHPDLVIALLQLFLQRMSEIQERLKEMVFKDLETRLARMLFQLASKHGRGLRDRWEITLKVTHQELSELVGGTRENVTTILNRFEVDGLIAKQRLQIAITDPDGLAERASLKGPEGASENRN